MYSMYLYGFMTFGATPVDRGSAFWNFAGGAAVPSVRPRLRRSIIQLGLWKRNTRLVQIKYVFKSDFRSSSERENVRHARRFTQHRGGRVQRKTPCGHTVFRRSALQLETRREKWFRENITLQGLDRGIVPERCRRSTQRPDVRVHILVKKRNALFGFNSLPLSYRPLSRPFILNSR